MKKQNSRLAIRLPSSQRNKIEKLVRKGSAKSLSQLIREALSELLSKEAINDEHHE